MCCYRWTGWDDWYVWTEQDPDGTISPPEHDATILLPLLWGNDEQQASRWPHVCRLRECDDHTATSRAVPVVVVHQHGGERSRRRRMVPAAGLLSLTQVAQAVGAASVFDSCPALPQTFPVHLRMAQVMAVVTQVRALLALPGRRSSGVPTTGGVEAAHRAHVAQDWGVTVFCEWLLVTLRHITTLMGGSWQGVVLDPPSSGGGRRPVEVTERQNRSRRFECARASETRVAGARAVATPPLLCGVAGAGGGHAQWHCALVGQVVSQTVTEVAVFVSQADVPGYDDLTPPTELRQTVVMAGGARDLLDNLVEARRADAETVCRSHAALLRVCASLAEGHLALEVRLHRAQGATFAQMVDHVTLDHVVLGAHCCLEWLATVVAFAMARHSPQLDGAQRRGFCRRLRCATLALAWDTSASA